MLQAALIFLLVAVTAVVTPAATATPPTLTPIPATATVAPSATPAASAPASVESGLPPWLQWVNTFLGSPIEVVGVLVVVIGVPSLAAVVRDHRRNRKRLQVYFTTLWEKSSRLDLDELTLQGRPYDPYYHERDEDVEIRQSLAAGQSVLVVAPPLGGKTRAIFEALLTMKPAADVLTVRHIDIKDLTEWDIPKRLTFWRKRVVVIDDLHRFVEMENFEHVISACTLRRLPIVTTCRSAVELEKAKESVGRRGLSLEAIFGSNLVVLGGVSEERAREIAGRTGVDWSTVRFNGCVGSVFMKLEEMERRFNALEREPKTVLQSMRTLYQCGIYRGRQEFPEEWVKITVDKEGLKSKKADWNDWLEDLQSKEFVRCGEASVWAEEVYLEDIVRPAKEAALLTVMQEMKDEFEDEPDGLVRLGYRAYSIGQVSTERAEYIEVAIPAYELALEVYTREAFPEQWAMSQNNLATAYSDRIRGERADTLEEAIRHYELALEVRTREAFPSDWAMTQNNLATAYSDRIRGERADNLEEAICHYELALEVRTREASPFSWAMARSNMAWGFRSLAELKDPILNCQRAVTACEDALSVRSPDGMPVQYAITQGHLGDAYRVLAGVENRGDNCQLARLAYKGAMGAISEEDDPDVWAELVEDMEKLRVLCEEQDPGEGAAED